MLHTLTIMRAMFFGRVAAAISHPTPPTAPKAQPTNATTSCCAYKIQTKKEDETMKKNTHTQKSFSYAVSPI